MVFKNLNMSLMRIRKGFTLIELLVVIAIISLLLSVILPSLKAAKSKAMRVLCFDNVRQQFLSQMAYATENDGKFASHTDPSPWYVSSGSRRNSCRELMDGYVNDSKVLLCPLIKSFGLYWGDLKYVSPEDSAYGSWDAIDPKTGQGCTMTIISYSWYGGYTDPAGLTKFKFMYIDSSGVKSVNEPVWPKKQSECSSTRAFIAHTIVKVPSFNLWWDLGHGGQVNFVPDVKIDFKDASKSRENPVGYADGHIEQHLRTGLKARAQMVGYSGQIIYY